MINRDYILRLAEQFGRELSIILGLRKRNLYEDALIYIDDLLLKNTGLTLRFVDALPEDALIEALSPLGHLNVSSCLTTAILLEAEGDVYEDMGRTNDGYYRYSKSLYLFLTALPHEPVESCTNFIVGVDGLLDKLADYELPASLKSKLFPYYEHIQRYGKAEDTLYELLEDAPHDHALIEQGRQFYTRLLKQDDTALQARNFSHEEAVEGLQSLQQLDR